MSTKLKFHQKVSLSFHCMRGSSDFVDGETVVIQLGPKVIKPTKIPKDNVILFQNSFDFNITIELRSEERVLFDVELGPGGHFVYWFTQEGKYSYKITYPATVNQRQPPGKLIQTPLSKFGSSERTQTVATRRKDRSFLSSRWQTTSAEISACRRAEDGRRRNMETRFTGDNPGDWCSCHCHLWSCLLVDLAEEEELFRFRAAASLAAVDPKYKCLCCVEHTD